jgi:hypothetical protein
VWLTSYQRPPKKNSTANAPTADAEPPATPTPSTPITAHNTGPYGNSGGKAAVAGLSMSNPAPNSNPILPANQPQLPQQDLSSSNAFSDFNAADSNFNLDFSTLEDTNVLENFDFDSFLNTNTDETYNFDSGIGVGDLNFDQPGE